jgi:hypothetical protein
MFVAMTRADHLSSTSMTSGCLHDEVPLTPAELVVYLWERHRKKRSERTLRLYRWKGGGPPFFRDGNEVRYSPRLADEWAIAQWGEPLRNNSEQTARRLLVNPKD